MKPRDFSQPRIRIGIRLAKKRQAARKRVGQSVDMPPYFDGKEIMQATFTDLLLVDLFLHGTCKTDGVNRQSLIEAGNEKKAVWYS